MYQALYRKYRPIDFNDVVGQEVIIKTLKNAILNNKINHAYLFTGPRGTGKTSIAKIFAKTINCLDLKNLKPCDKCVICTQINNKQTTDIIEIDAASNNGVEEIRELKSKVNLIPSNSKYKVYIIDEVHMLTIGAFNALLKTLEEPPKHVVFVLATTEPHKIPMTILSRCQRFDFKKIVESKLSERLKYICEEEKINITSDAIAEIAKISDGGMRDAISILDQVVAYSEEKITIDEVHEVSGTVNKEELKELLLAIFNKDITTIFITIEKYYKKGKNFVKLVEEIILFLRDNLLYLTIPEYIKESDGNYQIYDEILKITNKEKIISTISKFNLLLLDIKDSNNPKLLFELSIIEMINLKENNILKESIPIEQISISPPPIEKKKEEKLSKKEINLDCQIGEDLPNKKSFLICTPSFQKDNIDWDKLEILKKVRINNALVNPRRINLETVTKTIERLRSLTITANYLQFPALVLDGMIKAVTENKVIFVYDSENCAKIFNKNILTIEKMLEELLNEKYNVIALSNEEWSIHKNNYRNRKKKYELIEEKIKLEEIYIEQEENTIDDIQSLFGEIVEMK